MPQAEVARRTKGVYSQAAISGIERGLFRPPTEKIPVLLAAYGVTWLEVSNPVEEAAA